MVTVDGNLRQNLYGSSLRANTHSLQHASFMCRLAPGHHLDNHVTCRTVVLPGPTVDTRSSLHSSPRKDSACSSQTGATYHRGCRALLVDHNGRWFNRVASQTPEALRPALSAAILLSTCPCSSLVGPPQLPVCVAVARVKAWCRVGSLGSRKVAAPASTPMLCHRSRTSEAAACITDNARSASAQVRIRRSKKHPTRCTHLPSAPTATC